MNQSIGSISTRVSHRFTQKRGWTHSSSVQITMPIEDAVINPDEFKGDGSDGYDSTHEFLLASYMKAADKLGRIENERRNALDGWKPEEKK
jgi:hypothetical protein